jgi:hypothetical protein
LHTTIKIKNKSRRVASTDNTTGGGIGQCEAVGNGQHNERKGADDRDAIGQLTIRLDKRRGRGHNSSTTQPSNKSGPS